MCVSAATHSPTLLNIVGSTMFICWTHYSTVVSQQGHTYPPVYGDDLCSPFIPWDVDVYECISNVTNRFFECAWESTWCTCVWNEGLLEMGTMEKNVVLRKECPVDDQCVNTKKFCALFTRHNVQFCVSCDYAHVAHNVVPQSFSMTSRCDTPAFVWRPEPTSYIEGPNGRTLDKCLDDKQCTGSRVCVTEKQKFHNNRTLSTSYPSCDKKKGKLCFCRPLNGGVPCLYNEGWLSNWWNMRVSRGTRDTRFCHVWRGPAFCNERATGYIVKQTVCDSRQSDSYADVHWQDIDQEMNVGSTGTVCNIRRIQGVARTPLIRTVGVRGETQLHMQTVNVTSLWFWQWLCVAWWKSVRLQSTRSSPPTCACRRRLWTTVCYTCHSATLDWKKVWCRNHWIFIDYVCLKRRVTSRVIASLREGVCTC